VLVSSGKGSHRKFSAKGGLVVMIVPGRDGDDAKPYLEQQVRDKINKTQS
jgi:hypothetical protein